MEKIPNYEWQKRWLSQKFISLALCAAMAIGNSSCRSTTEKDVLDQENKIENIDFQISHYISARKNFVEKYNNLLKQPRTESNKALINESLWQLYKAIKKYDEKIEDLAEDRIDAEVDLNEYIADLGTSTLPSKPIDPNKWDFLLTIH